MPKAIIPSPPLVETHEVGTDSLVQVVRSDECPALATHHIAHTGIADAAWPYTMVRTHLPGSYFLACHEGQGRIYLDGRWQRCQAGWACLAPAHVLHAFHAIPSVRWRFGWVRYEARSGLGPLGAASAPIMAQFNSLAFVAAVQGLIHEQSRDPQPALLHHWIELIHRYVVRFAQPWHVDDRLSHLWEQVAAQPGSRWTLAELSRLSHCSSEHLRRLCQRQLGRSPMNQVTYLRMRHAAQRLTETDLKLDAIAQEVGYANPFVFSNTFKNWTGWRPSEYRNRKDKGTDASLPPPRKIN
jgi:AraC-like DNA-binding protein